MLAPGGATSGDAMDVDRVVIERRDGTDVCGVLVYHHTRNQQLVTWSFFLNDQHRQVLVIYPSSESAEPDVTTHYRALADAILQEIFHR